MVVERPAPQHPRAFWARSAIRAEAKKIPGNDDPVKLALFKQASDIREGLAKLGVVVEDRPTGTSWRVG